MASHMDAAKGAYLIRDFSDTADYAGTVIIRGTSCTSNLMKILPEINQNGPNVKIVAAVSWGLFQLQDSTYRESIFSEEEINDAMIITNGGLKLMYNWIANPVVKDYSMSSDWDDQWRSGGSVDEVVEEAHLSAEWIKKGIDRFASDRKARLACLRSTVPAS